MTSATTSIRPPECRTIRSKLREQLHLDAAGNPVIDRNTERRPLTDAEIAALRDFASLRINMSELQYRLRDVLRVNFDGVTRTLEFFFDDTKPSVLVDRTHLEQALEKRRLRLITEEELSEWASMLLLNDAYDFVPDDEDLVIRWLNDLSYGFG